MHLPKSDPLAVFSNLCDFYHYAWLVCITMHAMAAHWKITMNSYFVRKSDAHFRRTFLIKTLQKPRVKPLFPIS